MPNLASKPVIAIDIDEVLFPMVPDLIKYVEREHSVILTPEDFRQYSLEDVWPRGTTEGEIVFDSYKNHIKIEVAPVKDAAEVLGKISQEYDVIVMTSRDSKFEKATRDWLKHHFSELFKDVHLLGNSKDSVTWRSKAEVCKELGVHYLIDDSLRHILETHALGIKTILFGDYPWNKTDELPDNVVRLKNWQEVLEYFDAKG